MAGRDDAALDLLIENGLISLVRADDELKITHITGKAVGDVMVGANLCESVPVLFGLDEQILSLKRFSGRRVEMTNMAVIERDRVASRYDFVVLCDHVGGGFVLAIMPSLANNALTVDLEQNLRRRYQAEAQTAAQARGIAAANDALRRVNSDLVNFTRMISHDLKAPMRALRYSADDIEEALGDGGVEAQIEALDELRHHATRLSRMVADLLTYSRLDDKMVAAETVDTARLIDEIVRSLPRPARLDLAISGEWPEFTTIKALLDVVLRNLIDNAIKHHDRGEGLISVLAERVDGFLVVVVNDDGPGIPKDHQQAVLRPFVRVKSDHANDSGMGLAMVHKIVTDVGGRIDIGNRLDGRRGARIAISWPLTIMAV